LRHTGAARSPPIFPELVRYYQSFSFRFGLHDLEGHRLTGGALPRFFSSRSSCSWTSSSGSCPWPRLDPSASNPSQAVPLEARQDASSIACAAHTVRPCQAAKRRSARVATRTGDGGETSLFSKDRVRKTDRGSRRSATWTGAGCDRVARSLGPRSRLGRELLELQKGLYLAMAEIATPRADIRRLKARIDADAVARLDRVLEALKKANPVEGRFVIPGENRYAATVDHARTVARRAERRSWRASTRFVAGRTCCRGSTGFRTSLFVLARAAERRPTTER